MASIWTMRGEAGKSMDATSRTIEELGTVNTRITFRNLATDTLTYSINRLSLSSTAEIVPQLGQIVELFRAGIRFFKGHVTGVKTSGRRVDVTVSGPWWWLERVALENTATDATGVAGDRASYGFASQSLTDSLSALLNKAIALGVPMVISTLATTFIAPQIRLNQMNFAQAVAEICRITPDLALYFDYSGTTPAVRTVRRLSGLGSGSATPLTLDARSLSPFELDPKIELEVTRVRIAYLTRANDGSKKFATQNAGTSVLGKVMLHTVSGDEMDTFLPKDILDSVTIVTQGSALSVANVKKYDADFASVARQYGDVGTWNLSASFQVWEGTVANYSAMVQKSLLLPAATVSDEAGNLLSPSGNYLFFGQLPDWAIKQLDATKVKYRGTMYSFVQDVYSATTVYITATTAALSAGASTGNGFARKATSLTDTPNKIYWIARPFSYEGYILNKNYSSSTVVYRASDYAFRFPPSGFAAGLLAAQNYIPYEGRFTVTEDDAGATRYMTRAMNFSSSQAAHASINAMVTEESIEIGTGKTSVYLGPPARFSMTELVNKIRADANDQIQYL